MDLFRNYKLINDTFKANTETVLINEKPQQAIIAMSYLGMEEKRHISSLEPFKRGDIVEYRDEYFLIVEESVTPRHNKYRATMRRCDHTFVVRDFIERVDTGEVDFQGRPIYKDIYSDPYPIPSVMKQWERSLDKSFAINMMDITFFVDMQDTEKNRKTFATNEVFDIRGKNMRVILQDRSQEGLLGVLFLRTGSSPPYE